MPVVSESPSVTVVIPAFKRTRQLELAVRSVMQQDLRPEDFEIVVVDSSPDDSNLRMVEALRSQALCRLTCLRKAPEGPGPSRNLGAHTGAAPILAFMDSDCCASATWLTEGLLAFKDESVGLVQGRTMPEPDARHSVFNWSIQVEEESFLYETANIFYRRTAFEAAGGFLHDLTPNAERPLGGEDVDLAWKVKRSGWHSVFAEQALVFHEVIRLSVFRWFVNYRLFLLPKMVKGYPELRQFLAYRFFFDRIQVWTALAVLGLLLVRISFLFLALLLPYIYVRSAESSRTLKGPMRLLRVVLYAPRDLASMLTLLLGSLRYGALII